jgi:hypothetical protein
MSKKINKKSFWTAALGIIGAFGAIASVIALWPAFISLNQKDNPIAEISGSENAQIVGAGNTQINDSTIVYEGDSSTIKKELRKPVPRSFLDSLPRVKCQAYAEAKPLWDTGVTVTISEGNALVSDRLREALISTAEAAYTNDFFEGKTPEEYYSKIIDDLTTVSRSSMPREGTLYGILMGAAEIAITDDLIEDLIQDISDETYFLDWKSRWDEVEIVQSSNCIEDF